MAKKGKKQAGRQPGIQPESVPELQGRTKRGGDLVMPISNGVGAFGQMEYHRGRPIPLDVYPAIDTDLARDNLENDLTAADREDL